MKEYGIMEYLEPTVAMCGWWMGNPEMALAIVIVMYIITFSMVKCSVHVLHLITRLASERS